MCRQTIRRSGRPLCVVGPLRIIILCIVYVLLVGGSHKSVVVLDTNLDDSQHYTLSNLSADTDYKVSLVALGVAGQSDPVVVDVRTDAIKDDHSAAVAAFVGVAAMLAMISSLIAIYTCHRYVCFTMCSQWLKR